MAKDDVCEVNITLIGGGSYNWTPKLLADLSYVKGLGGKVTLMDINPDALSLMTKLGQKIMRDLKGNFEVKGTTDLEESLEGAQYIVMTINTGGYEATRQDMEIPEKYGIFQTVGDTAGPGGLIRGIRNIPVVANIAKKMEECCPDALFMNYSNPLCIITRTIAKTSKVKVVGLCHELLGLEGKLMGIFGVEERGRIKMKVAGINHFSWVLEAYLEGRDLFPELREHIRNYEYPEVSYEEFSPYADMRKVKYGLFETTGVLGVAGDRHIVEFYSNFISKESEYGWKYGVKQTDADEFERAYLVSGEYSRKMLSGEVALPKGASGEIVFEIIESIEKDLNWEFFVNLPNEGQISNLPRNRIVETYAIANAKGLSPIATGDLPPSVAPQVRLQSDIQEMIVEATLTNNKQLALQAFLLDPLVKDFDDGRKMFEEMCEAQGLFK